MTDENNKPTEPSPSLLSFKLERVLRNEISEDKLEVNLKVKLGFLFGHELNENEIYEYLQSCNFSQNNIDFKGIRTALKNLKEQLIQGNKEKESLNIKEKEAEAKDFSFIAVRGQLPEKGIDGWKKFKYPIASRVKIREDGSVDFRNTDKYTRVKKDEEIGILFEGFPGKPGLDVYGTSIPFPPITKAKITEGKNIQVKMEDYPRSHSENIPDAIDGLKVKVYYSTIDGVLNLTDSSISVSSELVIAANVGLETGNIDYEGSVIVKGNIEDGSKIKCQGSLIVSGNVETDEIVVAENLKIHGGIRTNGKGTIKIHGNLTAKFIENTVLEVDGDIVIEGAIIHSKIYCLGNIFLNGESGNLIGSSIITRGNVSLKNIGSISEGDVSVELGFHYRNDHSIKVIAESLKTMDVEMEKETQTINKIKQIIQRARGNLEQDKKEEYRHIFKDYTDKTERIKLLTEKLEELRHNRYNPDAVHFIARGGAFPGSAIKYRNHVEKFTVFESSFVITFFSGQENVIKTAYTPKA